MHRERPGIAGPGNLGRTPKVPTAARRDAVAKAATKCPEVGPALLMLERGARDFQAWHIPHT